MSDQHPPIYYVLQSRKFWATLVGLILMIITAIVNKQPIDPNTIVNAIMILVSVYVGSVALEDGMSKGAVNKTKIETPAANVQVTTTDAPQPPASPTLGNMG